MGRPKSNLTPLERRQRYRVSAKGRESKRRSNAKHRAIRNYGYIQRAEVRNQKHKLRMALYAEHKSRPCMDCGGTFDPVCMDFDHRPGEIKVGDVSRMVSTASVEAVKAEIAKCDVVCANCHRIRTHRKRNHTKDMLARRGFEYHGDVPQLSLVLDSEKKAG